MNNEKINEIEPAVSVLIPVYNTEKFIGAAIESILAQTFTNFELVICDDCSTDGTHELLEKYAAIDQRVTIIRNKQNLGISGNRNKLVKMSKGRYIAWQDADDISLPDRLEKQFSFLDNHPEVGIVGGYIQFFQDRKLLGIRKYETTDKSLRETIFRFAPVAQPAAMIRRSCLMEAGEYDLNFPLGEDLDMSFRIGSRHQFANLPEVLVHYREHSESSTYEKLREMELATLAIRKKYSSGWGYRMSIFDKLYNLLQKMSMYIIPPRLKIWLFCFFRNSKSDSEKNTKTSGEFRLPGIL